MIADLLLFNYEPVDVGGLLGQCSLKCFLGAQLVIPDKFIHRLSIIISTCAPRSRSRLASCNGRTNKGKDKTI